MSWLRDFLGFGNSFNGFDGFSRALGRVFNTSTDFNSYGDDLKKLKVIFSNPAMMKVVSLQCNMFSQGKIYVYNKSGEKVLVTDPFLDLMKQPNMMQDSTQWLWDYMFWKMVGNVYINIESKFIEDNTMYFMSPDKMYFRTEFNSMKDKFIRSKQGKNDIDNLIIDYRFSDGTTEQVKWSNVIHITDTSNGLGNWFKGHSKIDALYKIITNSEEAMNAENIATRFTGKWAVAGVADPNNVTELPLSDDEKLDIETKMNGRKQVHAFKSMLEVKKFNENNQNLILDEIYYNKFFLIGNMFDIPRDVLEASLQGGGTFNNQEMARGSYVSYCLQPHAEALMNKLCTYFGSDKNRLYCMDWEHLPFMQVFAKERAETAFKTTQSILNLQKAGASTEEINKFLDTDFKELVPQLNAQGATMDNAGQQQNDINQQATSQ